MIARRQLASDNLNLSQVVARETIILLVVLTIGIAAHLALPRRPRPNVAGRRRTSSRRRKSGRPSGEVVNERISVKLPEGAIDVVVEGGRVTVAGTAYGSVYDLGTSFRAVPRGSGEVRSFTTLAGAVKHVLRSASSDRLVPP